MAIFHKLLHHAVIFVLRQMLTFRVPRLKANIFCLISKFYGNVLDLTTLRHPFLGKFVCNM